MESSTYRKTDPSILLQNEIDILLTQIRLMELYIKQAQATAENEAARQSDEQQAEIVALRAQLARREKELQERQSKGDAVDQTLSTQLQALQTRFEDNLQLLQSRDTELQEANAEVRALLERMALLESDIRNRDAAIQKAEGQRQGLQAELASLRSELERKNSQLLQYQAAAQLREEERDGQLHQLQFLLTEKQGWLEAKEGELEQAKAEIARLARRVSDVESAAGDARIAAAHELELTRAKFHADLEAVHATLRGKEEALQDREGAIATLEVQLTGQIDGLRRELRENKELLDLRQRDLQSFQSRTADLHERIANLESENQQIKASAASEVESVRYQLETEIASVRAELQHKEQALAEHQLAVTTLEKSLQEQTENFQQQMVEKDHWLNNKATQLEKAEAEIGALLARIAETQASHREAQAFAVRELEQTRQSLQTEFTNLQAQVDEKEHALQEREAFFAETERLLQVQIQDLKRVLDEKRRGLEDREAELQDLRSQLHAQEERIRELLSAHERSQLALKGSESVRQGLQSELSNLQNEIGQKEQILAERQASFAAAEHSLQEQIQQLHDQLVEHSGFLESKDSELEQARSEIAVLREQRQQLEIATRDMAAEASRRTQQVRADLESELSELRATLAAKERQLQESEAAFKTTEINLNSLTDGLRRELAEKHSLIDRGNAELEQARAEVTALRRQNAELGLLSKQTENLLSVQGEQMRERVRAEIAALETQLKDRDTALLAAQTQLDQLQDQANTKVSELQCQLAEKQLLVESRATEINDLQGQINSFLEQIAQGQFSNQQTEIALNGEIARIRQTHDAEIAIWREELRRRQVEDEERAVAFTTREDNLRLELSDLRSQLAQKEELIEGRQRDFEAAKSELVALQERLASLQSGHHQEQEAAAREAQQIQAALRTELATKDLAIEERKNAIEGLEYQHREQIQDFRNQIAELQRLLDDRNTELTEARTAGENLRRRMAQFEAAADEIDQTKRQAQAAAAALQDDLTEKTTTLREQELNAKQQENALQSEIHVLRTEAREKHVLLESRNEELVRVKAELDLLQEHLTQLELSSRRAEETAATEGDKMRTEFQAQIAYLQAELSQRDWALAERQAVARASEQSQHVRHEESSPRESKTQEIAGKRDKEFVLGEPKGTGTHEEQSKKLQTLIETIKAEDEQRFAPARQRRWQSGWGWKRRWKT